VVEYWAAILDVLREPDVTVIVNTKSGQFAGTVQEITLADDNSWGWVSLDEKASRTHVIDLSAIEALTYAKQ